MFVVAHRTPRTAADCAALAAAGVAIFELDVQLFGDGLAVSHYLPVLRVPGWLEHDNWRLRWHSRGDPSLDDMLALLPGHARVLLDPKESAPRRRAELIERLRLLADRDRYIVSTANPADLAAFRTVGFRTWRTVKNIVQFGSLVKAKHVDDDAVSVRHTMLTRVRVAQLREVVPTVVAWTVNDVDHARRLVEWGVEGITSDQPTRITQI